MNTYVFADRVSDVFAQTPKSTDPSVLINLCGISIGAVLDQMALKHEIRIKAGSRTELQDDPVRVSSRSGGLTMLHSLIG